MARCRCSATNRSSSSAAVTPRAKKRLISRALARSCISFIAVRVKNLKTGAEQVLECAGVFVAIGHVPNTQLFKGVIDMDDAGYIKPKHGMETNVPGVFVAGDCSDKVYRQAVTAAGMGCAAAIDAERYLAKLNQ